MIAVVGSLNLDLVVPVPHHPVPGETVLGGTIARHPGGKGGNQAVAAARLSGGGGATEAGAGADGAGPAGARRRPVTMIARVGQDAEGALLRAALAAESVDIGRVLPTAGAVTGQAMITVERGSGENAIVVSPGANELLAAEDCAAAGTVLRDARVTLLQQEVPPETVDAAARLAGGTVVLNPAPARPLGEDLLHMVDVLVPNRAELEALVGAELPDQHAVADAARRLRGPASVVVTLGAEGALLVEDGAVLYVPPTPVRAVDTTAAGDAFCGALAVALDEGQALHEAVRMACAAGALAATRPGAQPSLPTREEVERLLAGGTR